MVPKPDIIYPMLNDDRKKILKAMRTKSIGGNILSISFLPTRSEKSFTNRCVEDCSPCHEIASSRASIINTHRTANSQLRSKRNSSRGSRRSRQIENRKFVDVIVCGAGFSSPSSLLRRIRKHLCLRRRRRGDEAQIIHCSMGMTFNFPLIG